MEILSWTENYGDQFFKNFSMSNLRRDEAYLEITNPSLLTAHLYSLYKECFQCPFTKEQSNISNNSILKVSTRWAKLYRVLTEEVDISPVNSNRSVLCTLNSNFGEFGVYSLEILENTCVLKTLKKPVNIYFPILTVMLIYTLIALLTSGIIHVWKIYWKKSERNTTSFDRNLETSQHTRRLRSLDTFRGISIVVMIFVHFSGGGYAFSGLTSWNGLQMADIPFPWFMWIMGVCIPISVSSRIKHGASKKCAFLNVLKRSCILFGLGLFLAGNYLDELIRFNALERLAICYFVVASAFILCPSGRQAEYDEKKNVPNMWRDIFALKYQWMVGIVLLIIHTLFTFMLPVPGCPKGYLGPGGLHADKKFDGCTGGAAGYINNVILRTHGCMNNFHLIYRTGPFEPIGKLGFLTSTLQVIIGTQAGAIVLHYKEHTSRLVRWLVWGVALGLAGGILCGFSKENGFIPVNRSLWSVSYVMVTSSLAFLLLAFCYYVIDAKDYWSGKPFLFAGMNSIFMYIGHSLTYSDFPIRWVPATGMSTHFITLAESVWATGMWVLIAYYLYRKKFFLHV